MRRLRRRPGAAGAFPLWLAPVQARILPVTDAVAGYASEVAAQMRAAGIRVEVASGAGQRSACKQLDSRGRLLSVILLDLVRVACMPKQSIDC